MATLLPSAYEFSGGCVGGADMYVVSCTLLICLFNRCPNKTAFARYLRSFTCQYQHRNDIGLYCRTCSSSIDPKTVNRTSKSCQVGRAHIVGVRFLYTSMVLEGRNSECGTSSTRLPSQRRGNLRGEATSF
eukprot:gb/GECG01002479.1/.p1 GENE.gb/GECG01002479.1/~~gb/GECG01002479.1/.p1  ORF type:complete len:131 (+),score=4.21 gb/GECG01002479.1/:1-393(+)